MRRRCAVASAPARTRAPASKVTLPAAPPLAREMKRYEDEDVVEVDLAAAVGGVLHHDHVPVDLAAVAVVGLLVRLTGRQVEAAGDLLVEQDVLHRLRAVRVEPDGELADVAAALVHPVRERLARVRDGIGRRDRREDRIAAENLEGPLAGAITRAMHSAIRFVWPSDVP